jgi:hypothetical protein
MDPAARTPRFRAQDALSAFAAARWTHRIPGDNDGHNPFMDPTQAKIIELLREVHLIAFKEIERLNMRIVELENQNRHAAERNPSGHRLEGGVLHILSNKGFLSVAGTFLRFSAGSGCRSRCATRNSGPGPGKDYPKAP